MGKIIGRRRFHNVRYMVNINLTGRDWERCFMVFCWKWWQAEIKTPSFVMKFLSLLMQKCFQNLSIWHVWDPCLANTVECKSSDSCNDVNLYHIYKTCSNTLNNWFRYSQMANVPSFNTYTWALSDSHWTFVTIVQVHNEAEMEIQLTHWSVDKKNV